MSDRVFEPAEPPAEGQVSSKRKSVSSVVRPKRALRKKGAARRELIMNAAEAIFSERGYYGTSLRDVSARSGAALGVLNHYFPTKEILFYEIVMRKRDRLADLIRESLEGAKAKSNNDFDVIEAFIRPFLRSCVDKESEFRNYIKLTSGAMSAYLIPEVATALVELQPITILFQRYLGEAVPEMPASQLKIVAYLIDAALVFMVQDTGFLDRVTEGEFPTESINELIRPAATFFTGGLRALAEDLG